MLDICLLGSGGMMPLPYRWLTALMVGYNAVSYTHLLRGNAGSDLHHSYAF